MPVYIAVRCFQCQMFQVIQKPKSKKFKCSICNNKQSVRKVYCTSDRAKDCRIIVQQYNKRYGEMVQEAQETALQENVSDINNDKYIDNIHQDDSSSNVFGKSGYYYKISDNAKDFHSGNAFKKTKSSQWEEYLSDDDQDVSDAKKSNYNGEVEDTYKFVFDIGNALRKKSINKRKKKDIESNNIKSNSSMSDNASTNVKKRKKLERTQDNGSFETTKFTTIKSSNSSTFNSSSTTDANTQNIYFASQRFKSGTFINTFCIRISPTSIHRMTVDNLPNRFFTIDFHLTHWVV